MANPKLPVFDSASEAYRTVWASIGYLPTAAALPFVLSLLLSLPVSLQPTSQGLGLISWLLEALPYTLFAVAWHRLVMLGPSVAPPRLAFAWAPRHWRFLGYALLIATGGVVMMGTVLTLANPASGTPGLGPLLALFLMISFCYVMIRLSLVLPATALDEDYQLRHSWMHTRGQGLRLLAAVTLVMVPVAFASLLVLSLLLAPSAGADVAAPSGGRFLMTQLTLAALGYIGTALSTTVFAQAFGRLAGWYPGDQHRA